MNLGRVLTLVLCVIAFRGCVNQIGATKLPSEKSKDDTMQIDEIPYMPFGLTKESDLDGIRIRLAFISAKTGAGKQEIVLTGKGHVSLFFSRSFQDKTPKIMALHPFVWKEFEASAVEQDRDSEVFEVPKTSCVGFQDLDFGIEPFRRCI